MPAGRPARHDQLAGPDAMAAALVAEPANGGVGLRHDVAQARVRRQGVAGQRDVEARRHRAFRQEAENLLGVALPIAAMEEHEQGCIRGAIAENVDPVALARPIAQVERIGMAFAQARAALRPLRDPGGAVGDRGAVVVGRVELRARHAAPHDIADGLAHAVDWMEGAAPRQAALRARLLCSLRPSSRRMSLNSGADTSRGRGSSILISLSMRPGPGDITTTRSARKIASSME